MSLHARRLRAPAILITALAMLLALAAAASAETRTGESSTVIREGFPAGEVTLVKAAASYESNSGSAVFNVTTATGAPPTSEGLMLAALTTSPDCAGQKSGKAIVDQLLVNPPPLLVFENYLADPTVAALAGSLSAPSAVPATKAVNGTTTTLSATSSSVANAGFNCAIVVASEAGEEAEEPQEEEEVEVPGATFMSFPISAPPAPPSAPVVTATAPPPPAVAPARPVLSIGKLKPASLKPGKWKSVKVKVTNTGAGGTGLGSLRVRTAKGVLVKPERQRLPALAPRASWTMTVRVRLTLKAKPRSKLKLTAAASGVTATRSLVLKAKGLS